MNVLKEKKYLKWLNNNFLYEKIDYKKLKGNLKILDKTEVAEKDITHPFISLISYLKYEGNNNKSVYVFILIKSDLV